MGMKGRSFCHSLLCLVFTGDRGRAPRRRWTSSCACWVSTSNTRRMCPPMITPHITEGRTRACTRTRVLRRTMVTLHPGQLGIDTYLGQKPKLGGRYADTALISISCCVGTLYIHVFVLFLVFVLLCFCFLKTQKDQKYFCYFSLVCFFFLPWFAFPFFLCLNYSKNPKRFCFACFSLLVLV